jgi:hypothetical protein
MAGWRRCNARIGARIQNRCEPTTVDAVVPMLTTRSKLSRSDFAMASDGK